ncbi:threonine-phosphate decarboxylase CobD [Blastochloris sulfoviridis]|uniref:threonine-phosphate decarboxylase n=1 Tax=Blastochloris sulfoviridis TaxID=50712 RepID=A0A5M6HQM5_9HYPH|nr:threonine-phosphate decarboxylase CobD [Blastochloris sulfoviridis]KAA5598174.1 threonine-phosphate decarboxylase [Blastochloris sulfoviridis]
MNESTASLRAHGGRIDAAARLYPAAPQPWVDLSTGINPHPYPVAPVDPVLWHRLPLAADLDRLTSTAAARYGRPAGTSLLPVPGSEVAIRLLPRLLGVQRVGIVGPTYGSHAAAWQAAGCAVETLAGLPLPAIDLDAQDLDAQDLDARDLDALVVVNPNNPDGRRWVAADLLGWATAWSAAGRWLIVDEAFADTDPGVSLLTLPALPPRVVVLRSLGKFFGLAGLRLGFVAADDALAGRFADTLGDWPVSGPACAVGAAALDDTAWIAATRDRLAAERARLDELLAGAGFTVLGGTDLFRLAERPAPPAGAADLADHFARRGLLVRGFEGMPHRLRFGLPGDAAAWRRLEDACAALDSSPGGT